MHAMKTRLILLAIVAFMMTGCSPASKVQSEPNT